jgi:hypothetical protein
MGGQLSGGFHYLGTPNFQETRGNIGYGLQIEKQLRLGISANFWHFGFREKAANINAITFSPSVWYKIGDIGIGAIAKNIGTRKNSSNWVQESIVLGFGYQKHNVRLMLEIEKFSMRQLLLRTAIVYKVHKDFSIQYGITYIRFNQHLGFSYTRHKMRFELAIYHQNRLGASSGTSAIYSE